MDVRLGPGHSEMRDWNARQPFLERPTSSWASSRRRDPQRVTMLCLSSSLFCLLDCACKPLPPMSNPYSRLSPYKPLALASCYGQHGWCSLQRVPDNRRVDICYMSDQGAVPRRLRPDRPADSGVAYQSTIQASCISANPTSRQVAATAWCGHCEQHPKVACSH